MPISTEELFGKSADRITTADLFGNNAPKRPSAMKRFAMAGPIARGMKAADEGANFRDLPAVLASPISGMLAGAPRKIADNPMAFAMGGPSYAQMLPANSIEKRRLPYPRPATQAGESLSNELGMLGGLIPIESGLRTTGMMAGKVLGKTAAGKSISNTKNMPKFAERVRGAFYELPRKFGEKFGSQVDELEKVNPDQTVNIGSEIVQLADDARNNSDLARRISFGLKKLGDKDVLKQWQNLLENKFFKSDWTLGESQKFIRAVKNAPGMAGKLAKQGSRFDPNEIPMLEFYGNVRQRQVEAFPEFADTLKEFSGKMGNWNRLKNEFKFGKTIKQIKTKFGDEEIEQAIKQILPDDLVKEIGGVRNAYKALKAAKVIGSSVGLGALGAAGWKIAKETGND